MKYGYTSGKIFTLLQELKCVINEIYYDYNKGCLYKDKISLMIGLYDLDATVSLMLDNYDESCLPINIFDNLIDLKQQIKVVMITELYGDSDYDKKVELLVLDMKCRLLLEKVKSTIRLREQENKRGK